MAREMAIALEAPVTPAAPAGVPAPQPEDRTLLGLRACSGL
jgi:hypothetical protein